MSYTLAIIISVGQCMAGGSTKVILISLGANFGIALSKLAGAMFTGSAALMAESVHSFSDCGNQGLLLYGQYAGKKPPTAKHPLGKSKETFFWSFVVALLLFSVGGMFSIYEGLHKINHPEPLAYPFVGIAILLVACALEGYSCWMCLKEVEKQNTYGSLWRWVRRTTSADLLVILLEDLAAMLGLIFALVALMVAWISGNTFWDGVGSVMIGTLLIVVAVILAREVKSLLLGEAPADSFQPQAEILLQEVIPGARLLRFIALQQGVGSVLVAYKVQPPENLTDVSEAIACINRYEQRMREVFPEIHWQFAELDNND